MVINQTILKYLFIAFVIVLMILANWSAFGHGSKPKEPEPKPKPIVTTITHITPVDYSTCSANAAISGVPGISHHKHHKSHTSIGVGLGQCEGSSGAAIGLNHQRNDMSLKATIGTSGGKQVFSGGLSIGF